MTTPSSGELLAASQIQALLDIRDELFKLNKTLERLVDSLEEEEIASVKDINLEIKKFFDKKERT